MHLNIFYSEDDDGFIAVSDDYPGLSAFGETQEEAEKEIKKVVDEFGHLWLHRKTAADDAAKEGGCRL